MKVYLYGEGSSYYGDEYYYDTETKRYFVEEYMWHIDDSKEVLSTREVSAEKVIDYVWKSNNLIWLARLYKYCGVDTKDHVKTKIKEAEESRIRYWEEKAESIGLFEIKQTSIFARQHKPGDYRKVYNKQENHYELEHLICLDPYIILSVVFDKNRCFLFYDLTWFSRQKESIRIDIRTETKYLLHTDSLKISDDPITENIMSFLRVNDPHFHAYTTLELFRTLKDNLTKMNEFTFYDILKDES